MQDSVDLVGTDTRTINAPVSGCVRSILVKEDDIVTRDVCLLVLECMKTELRIKAGCRGRVADIRVVEGDLIQEGDVLVDLMLDAGEAGLTRQQSIQRSMVRQLSRNRSSAQQHAGMLTGPSAWARREAQRDPLSVTAQTLKKFVNNVELLALSDYDEIAQLVREIVVKEMGVMQRRIELSRAPRWRPGSMFRKVLIANRGEVACRIIRTCQRLGIRTVAIHSDADVKSPHVAMADESFALSGNTAPETYLNRKTIVQIAHLTGADAIHPGYGFLSENADFAADCETQGIVFIGPTSSMMRAFGLKHEARDLATRAGVPTLSGSDIIEQLEEAEQAAERIGYPVLLKAAAGGGGIGIQHVPDASKLAAALQTTRELAQRYFNDGRVFVEKYIARARHVEVQVFGDGRGNAVHLGERECSIQRRHQKVIEETPACISETLRRALCSDAVKLAETGRYKNIGTVEFLVDADSERHYFIEMNTRLQVEHGVTELVHNVDLVEWMLLEASGQMGDLRSLARSQAGHAIQARVYAEDPFNNFAPSLGTISKFTLPEWSWVRYDTALKEGLAITPFYDPMISKVITFGKTRNEAIDRLNLVLTNMDIKGVITNIFLLKQITQSPVFRRGTLTTSFLDQMPAKGCMEILEGGMQTTVQDWPGRVGMWNVGVPPSGPMDPYAFRLANRLVGNPSDAAGLEITTSGPTIKFCQDSVIAVTGAPFVATLNGSDELPCWEAVKVFKGDIVSIAEPTLAGCRCYLAVRGGIDVPPCLGSRATFAKGALGPVPRTLESGDLLPIGLEPADPVAELASPLVVPRYSTHWDIRVLPGPHEAPDFFTHDDVATFYNTDWKVHYNSNRLGIRLEGQVSWQWARKDGGEGGSHPSNVHDNVYAIGSVNFTGNLPVIITQDGPSLGGFVCIATVITGDMWKLGQLKPNDSIRFRKVPLSEALTAWELQDLIVRQLDLPTHVPKVPAKDFDSAVVATLPEAGPQRPSVVYRMAGDCYVLVEYGEMRLDLGYRFRVHALEQAIAASNTPGVLELSPGVRSLQVKYDGLQLPLDSLLAKLADIEQSLPAIDTVSTRIIHLPLAYDDRWCREAVQKYMASIRSSGPWLPSNVKFVAKCNGITEGEVKQSVFSSDFMVLGLGDVYLGAPCAVALDPSQRLVVPKYNPARTFTPEGAVGLGGAYMCIYPMASPGGYQLVGRTLPIWNGLQTTADFATQPWLLRNFDRIRFYMVSEDELKAARKAFRAGTFPLQITSEDFSLASYQAALDRDAVKIESFHQKQAAASKVATVGY